MLNLTDSVASEVDVDNTYSMLSNCDLIARGHENIFLFID
ncbi:hypothetical protein GJS26_04400 [Pectobacterium carotovorum subsp. carotovorum]|nr:hypothetical protein [Pectobacterium carotovorum subsp. carotovorum]